MNDPTVLTWTEGSVSRISLNRPDKHNAMNIEMLDLLDQCIREADADPSTHVIVISGEGPSFSAGHDLKERQEVPWVDEAKSTPEGVHEFESKYYYEYSMNVRNTQKPTIAQIHGSCLAAGLMLVAMCDLAVASDDAIFGVPIVRFGFAGGEVGYEVWEVGARRAKELLFTGGRIDAHKALEWGFLNRVVPQSSLAAEVSALANEIAAQPPTAVSLLKGSINQTLDMMGQADSFSHHFMVHLFSHATDETNTSRVDREQRGAAAWRLAGVTNRGAAGSSSTKEL